MTEVELPPLQPLTRGEFFARVGLLAEADKTVTQAYWFLENMYELEEHKGHGRDDLWHVSFHGSQFPGRDPKACGRQNLYRMLNMPRGRFNRRSRQYMDGGKDHEMRLTRAWHRAGMLLSPPPWESQLQWEDPDTWLTCTTDALVLPLRSRKPFVCEVKEIKDEHVDEMIKLIRTADAKYVNQARCEIGMAARMEPPVVKRCHNTGRLAISSYLEGDFKVVQIENGPVCPQHWTHECLDEEQLEPIDYGFLYFCSRNDPMKTFEYYFENDPAFMAAGFATLAGWREDFIAERLPQTNFIREGEKGARFAHPFGWKWGELPCKWCDFGEACREDMKTTKRTGNPVSLPDSAAVEFARSVDPQYDFKSVKKSVFRRWAEDSAMIPVSDESRKEAA